MSDGPRPTRLALIGVGGWGKNIVRTIGELDRAVLAGVATRTSDPSSFVGTDCPVHADWRKVVDRDLVDGVIVATPPALHYEMCMEVIRAGLPLLVEKPLTLNLEEAIHLLARAREHGGMVMVDHTHLFNPAFRALKRRLPEAGKILGIRAVMGNWGPFRPDVPVLWDWGSHHLAMCLDLLETTPQKMEIVSCRRQTKALPEGLGEMVEVRLIFDGNVEVDLRFGNTLRPKTSHFSVYGDQSVLVYNDLADSKLMFYDPTEVFVVPEGEGRAVEVEPGMPLTIAIREFVGAIAEASKSQSQLALGVQVVEALSRCERS